MKLTILSPHLDDAAFSLYFALTRWRDSLLNLTVVNFFTASTYAPCVDSKDQQAITRTRRREDRRVLSRINPRINIVDLGLLDAPVRLRVDMSQVCSGNAGAELLESELQSLQAYLELIRTAAVLAPLGLGNHVDHLTVHHAAIRAVTPSKLGFYEDLPYATRTSNEELRQKVLKAERAVGCFLQPVTIRSSHSRWRKRQAISGYASQITSTEAETIARWTNSSGTGERLWLPRNFPHRNDLR